jgi:hypothetical protein
MKHILIITITGKSLIESSLIPFYKFFRQLSIIPALIGWKSIAYPSAFTLGNLDAGSAKQLGVRVPP